MFKVIPLQKTGLKSTKDADIVEVWFDRIPKKTHEEILKKCKQPLIYKMEKFNDKKLNEEVIKKSQFIDIDIDAPKRLFNKIKKINPKIKTIVSYHNFKETPYEKDLKKIYKKMLNKGADIVKFATHAKAISDSFRMLDFLSSLNKKGQKAICLCMGEHGLLTRISGHMFGNYLMYFTSSKNTKTAPGQITIKEFNKYIHES